MKKWRGEFNNPFVKGVTVFAVCLFLAFNFPVAFLAIVAVALCYAVTLLGVAYAYRNRHAIVGKPEFAVRFVRKTFSDAREGCSRTVVHALEERERQKLHKREREERLRRYKRERNRRKRQSRQEGHRRSDSYSSRARIG
jgi:hypothetical protein